MRDDWKPQTFALCSTCGDVVYSEWPGHFAACSCLVDAESTTDIAVDETSGHVRMVGNGPYEVLVRQEQE